MAEYVQVPVSLIMFAEATMRNGTQRERDQMAARLDALLSQPTPSVEDMAPGTTFTAEGVGVSDTQHRFTVTDKVSSAGYRYLRCATHDGNGALASYVDPSTIRDVTPPTNT